jgi:uncharacterized membrane protein
MSHRRALQIAAGGTGCQVENTPDAFGRLAEKAARFFGTPQYILGQTAAVLARRSTRARLPAPISVKGE